MDVLFNLIPVLIILLPVLFFGGLGWYFIGLRKRARQRVESFQTLAAELNFKFLGEVPYANLSGAASSELFTSGNAGSQHIYNLMTGAINNFQVSIFDFAYYTGRDDNDRPRNSNLHFQTIVMLDFAQINLPRFSLKPESGSVMKAVNNALGNRSGEIKFPPHPVFNEKYLLRGADEQHIRALFNDRAISFYESDSGLSTEGGGNRLIFYRSEVKIEPPQIRATLDEALTAANSFLNPNFARNEI